MFPGPTSQGCHISEATEWAPELSVGQLGEATFPADGVAVSVVAAVSITVAATTAHSTVRPNSVKALDADQCLAASEVHMGAHCPVGAAQFKDLQNSVTQYTEFHRSRSGVAGECTTVQGKRSPALSYEDLSGVLNYCYLFSKLLIQRCQRLFNASVAGFEKKNPNF